MLAAGDVADAEIQARTVATSNADLLCGTKRMVQPAFRQRDVVILLNSQYEEPPERMRK
jgi:hypothetical protein